MMTVPALLSATLLLLVRPATLTEESKHVPINVSVENSIQDIPPVSYNTSVIEGWILLAALRRLQESGNGFTFTYTEDPNYGPFLESVNGLSGSFANSTYWELLVKKPIEGIQRLNNSIGCYTPAADDQIILNYNRY